MDNELIYGYGQHQTFNGEDCLIIPLRNIINAEITQMTDEYPRIIIEYWRKL